MVDPATPVGPQPMPMLGIPPKGIPPTDVEAYTALVATGKLPSLSGHSADADAHHGLLAFNVKDYGATGDGTTNDSTAIQSAVNAAGAVGGQVFFPYGTYHLGTKITLPADKTTVIVGAGFGSRLEGSVNPLVDINDAEARLYAQNMAFEVSGSNAAIKRYAAYDGTAGSPPTVWLDHCEFRATSTSSSVSMIFLGGAKNVLITNCWFHGASTWPSPGPKGIRLEDSGDGGRGTCETRIINCVFRDLWQAIHAETSHSDLTYGVEGLTITSCFFIGNEMPLNLKRVFEFHITDCIIDGNKKGISLDSSDPGRIIGNYISTINGDGVGFATTYGSINDVIIANNRIVAPSLVGVNLNAGQNPVHYCIVQGNTILTPTTTGVRLAGASDTVNADINGVFNNILRSLTNGVLFVANADNCSVVGNIIAATTNDIVNAPASTVIEANNPGPDQGGPADQHT